MKKSFLSAAALVLTMGLSAYAQDDYEDYAYDEGVAESAPESSYSEVSDDAEADLNEYASTAKGRTEELKEANAASSAAEESSYDSQYSSGSSVSASVDKPLRYGGHVGIGLSGTYGNEDALIVGGRYGFSGRLADPFSGFLGINVDLGGIVSYRINKMFAVSAELNLHIIDYMKESEVWNIEVSDGYGYHEEPLDENMMLVDISIPIMARFYPKESFYIEAGAQVNLNLAGSFTLDNTDYDYSEDMGDWKGESFGLSVNVGGGFVQPIGNSLVEFGARFILDMTRLEADQIVYNGNTGEFRSPVATKGWHVQFVCNYFI